ncbi:MAG TPA: FAD-dependent oxidoreductase, partial [Chloroflexota bacterium]|nr:FAD-dependent oxidoreductase [Chloroflexota bacterium]
ETFVARTQLLLKHPIHYLDGGWQTLVNALRERAERSGARIEAATGVESIDFQGGLAQGVRLRDGRAVSASAVIVATSPRDAVKLLGDRADSSLRKTIDNFVPAQVACLDVALQRLPTSRQFVVQDLDRPRFLTIQSQYARIAPAGAVLLHTMKQLDLRQPADPRDDERDLEDLLDATLPGWREVVVRRSFLPRLQASSALPTAVNGGFAGRPGPRVEGGTDLYLAGDWVGPEGFLTDASLASARQAAHMVAETQVSANRQRMAVRSAR